MNVKAEKPTPKMGTASDGRPMHYSVGAIITDEQGRFLLLDRRHEPYGFAGMAGHVDDGEEPADALMREGREEIGVNLLYFQYVCEEEVPWNHCRSDGAHRIEVHYWHLYRATVHSDNVTVDPREAKRWGWFTKDEIRSGWYERRGARHALVLESAWVHWFKKVGILAA